MRILFIAAKESYARERQAALENAGYAVTSALNFKEIKEACAHQRFDLAIVGAYFDPKMKRAIGLTLHEILPNTPILEISHGEQEIPDAQYTTGAEVEEMLNLRIRCLLRGRLYLDRVSSLRAGWYR